MGSITVRNLDDEVINTLKEEARANERSSKRKSDTC